MHRDSFSWDLGKISWTLGSFISYDDFLFFVPIAGDALLITEDFYREYEIIRIANNETIEAYIYISMFQNELLGITEQGAHFHDGTVWDNFEMEWGDLEGRVTRDHIQFMVVHTKVGDHLFAFTDPV